MKVGVKKTKLRDTTDISFDALPACDGQTLRLQLSSAL